MARLMAEVVAARKREEEAEKAWRLQEEAEAVGGGAESGGNLEKGRGGEEG